MKTYKDLMSYVHLLMLHLTNLVNNYRVRRLLENGTVVILVQKLHH